jgi:Ser/Thr protein kinase RdoA (MazF antagonist)
VTLWRWLDAGFGVGDPGQGAAVLHACHAVLGAVDEPFAEWDALREAREVFAPRAPAAHRTEIEELGAAVQDAVRPLKDGLRPVHGDSHPGNLLWTARGPVLTDWEDAHAAPLEWDLACLVGSARVFGDDFGWSEAALGAYPGVWDADRLERCLLARSFQGVAYSAALVGGRPQIAPRLAARLAWLRERLA